MQQFRVYICQKYQAEKYIIHKKRDEICSHERLSDTDVIHNFRYSVPVRKLHACCQYVQECRAKPAALVTMFKAKAVYIMF